MLKLAIVEDDELYIEQLTEYVKRYEKENQVPVSIHIFHDGQELLADYQPYLDIILLDIEMPGVNGMDAAEKIRKTDEEVIMMFITNMMDFAIRGYGVDAFDFVVKPIAYPSFQEKFHRAVQRAMEGRKREIILRVRDGVVRIAVKKILYIEIANHTLIYHTEQKDYVVRKTLQAAEKEFYKYNFAKCNNQCLVNMCHVRKVTGNIVVVNGRELSISRKLKKDFLYALANYMGGN